MNMIQLVTTLSIFRSHLTIIKYIAGIDIKYNTRKVCTFLYLKFYYRLIKKTLPKKLNLMNFYL